MVKKEKRGSFSALSHPILALAVLVIAISIGVSFTQSALNFSTTGADKILNDGDGNFEIDESVSYSAEERVVLSSTEAFVRVVNGLVEGERIMRDVSFDQGVTKNPVEYQVRYFIDADAAEYDGNNGEIMVDGGKKSINEYRYYVTVSEFGEYERANVDRVINIILNVWYDDGSSETTATFTEDADRYDGADLRTWAGPNSDTDRDGDGKSSREEQCQDSPTRLSVTGVELFYCGKTNSDVIVSQIYQCTDCESNNYDRDNFGDRIQDGVGVINRRVNEFFFDNQVGGSRDIFCGDGIMYPENKPPEEQVCIQCEPEKDTCYIKGFELPQDVTQDTSFGTIAGQGDPTYVFYHQSFPTGEEEGWQLDEFSAFSFSTVAAGGLGAAGGAIGKAVGFAAKSGLAIVKNAGRAGVALGGFPFRVIFKLGKAITPEAFALFQRALSPTKIFFEELAERFASRAINSPQDALRLMDELVLLEGKSYTEARELVFRKSVQDSLDDAIQTHGVDLTDEEFELLMDIYIARSHQIGPRGTIKGSDFFDFDVTREVWHSNLQELPPAFLEDFVVAASRRGNHVLDGVALQLRAYMKHTQGFRDKFIEAADDLAPEDMIYKGATFNSRAFKDALTKQLDSVTDNIDSARLQRLVNDAIERAPAEDVDLVTASLGGLTDDATLQVISNAFADGVADSAVQRSLAKVSQYIPAAKTAGVLGSHYTASVALAVLLIWEDSVNDKYTNLGVNSVTINTPSLFPVSPVIPEDRNLRFLDSVKNFPILLDKDGVDGEKISRFMLASPCKTDLIIEKKPCTCQGELAISNNNGEPYELRQSSSNVQYWIPTKGVRDDGTKVVQRQTFAASDTRSEFMAIVGDTFSFGLQSLAIDGDSLSLVTSSGGDDSYATYECTDRGWFGDNVLIYDNVNVNSECLVVSAIKDNYSEYNDGYNYCYMRDPSGNYVKQGILFGTQLAIDSAITYVALGGTVFTGGTSLVAGYALLGLSGAVFHVAGNEIAEEYKWPRGGTG